MPEYTYTDTQLLDLTDGVGQRADTFEFTLVDDEGNNLGTLRPNRASPGRVSVDTSRITVWTCDGLQIPNVDANAINPLSDRLAVTMRLQNGSGFPLGTYMFGDHNRTRSPAEVWQPNLFDRCFILNQSLGKTHARRPGASLQEFFTAIANDVGITQIAFEVGDTDAGTTLTYPAGSNRYDALKALAALMGAFPPYMDASNVLVVSAPPDILTGADRSYGPNGHLIRNTVTATEDSYRAPNRYVVTAGNAQAPIVGIYDLPDSAPQSFVNRGFRVTVSTTQQGLKNNSQATQAAKTLAMKDHQNYEKVTFQSTADPRHGVYDVIQLEESIYLETGWSLNLVSGGTHDHSCTRIWDGNATATIGDLSTNAVQQAFISGGNEPVVAEETLIEVSLPSFLVSEDDASDYEAMLAGTGTAGVTANSGGLYGGQLWQGPGTYFGLEGLLNFDTSAILDLPLAVTLRIYVAVGSSPLDDDCTLAIAAWNYGTADGGDWIPYPTLSGFTVLDSFAFIAGSTPTAGTLIQLSIDPSAVVLGGATQFVLFSTQMAAAATPIGVGFVVIDLGGDYTIPTLSVTA